MDAFILTVKFLHRLRLKADVQEVVVGHGSLEPNSLITDTYNDSKKQKNKNKNNFPPVTTTYLGAPYTIPRNTSHYSFAVQHPGKFKYKADKASSESRQQNFRLQSQQKIVKKTK